jgi:hypothetical protein
VALQTSCAGHRCSRGSAATPCILRAATDGGVWRAHAQFLGFSDGATSVITSVWSTIGAQVGLVLGGVSGDLLARRFPIAARPATNQVSIALVMPLVYVGYKVMPGCARYATGVAGTMDYLTWRYSLLNFVTGALQSWCAANNSTIYAEVRPPRPASAPPPLAALPCDLLLIPFYSLGGLTRDLLCAQQATASGMSLTAT